MKRPSQRDAKGAAVAPAGLESWTLSFGGDEYVVLSFPSPPAEWAGLTAAEAGVLEEILAGRSNREIAQGRAASVRTVANQVASILRKLGVRSRYELVSRLAGGRTPAARR